jgi:metal-dependent HD superfamily phosphatase/phosphodiesterase
MDKQIFFEGVKNYQNTVSYNNMATFYSRSEATEKINNIVSSCPYPLTESLDVIAEHEEVFFMTDDNCYAISDHQESTKEHVEVIEENILALEEILLKKGIETESINKIINTIQSSCNEINDNCIKVIDSINDIT